ncbi:hypothetical protein ASG01_11115 [Chryseobacterium sp. Leaf180]|uniref:BspA family leucine-rich repeat surface protein n=1 Tax=Chryseobacterium sp. Leaf180 TaxID=1736289 RepID=UPI0006FA226E|nr:BspA family leucine-rich repeat surface protein [Chryseobacterium sp. Leaf180]KQR92463.1 hypothetical protein ASG01_11115 [Chryseobacterium sp. Leaf180]
MIRNLLIISLLIFFSITKAQEEFITVWKPGTAQEIHFPGKGNNYNIFWEEIGFPQHNGSYLGISSVNEYIIVFGMPVNPNASQATYRVKITNGAGSFTRFRVFNNEITPVYLCSDSNKLFDVAQWGNIQWQTFDNAFTLCMNMNVSATDVPNLSGVTSTKEMFYICPAFTGNPSFNNWQTSTLTNIISMFSASSFNAPIGNWDVSNVTNFKYVFDESTFFNQPLRNWNTSSAQTMEHMFHAALAFNQNIDSWDTSNVTNMDMMFALDGNFNQNLGNWNLSALTSAVDMFISSGMNCQNYDSTLFGWNNSSSTPPNINLGNAAPLTYSHSAAISARSELITSKNWQITGDVYNPNCNSFLSLNDIKKNTAFGIYPNPSSDFIYLKNVDDFKNYSIIDLSGKMIQKQNSKSQIIDIRMLPSGNYILQLETKDKLHQFKFIKK